MIFCEREGCCTRRTAPERSRKMAKKDAFSVISDGEWNPYANFKRIEVAQFALSATDTFSVV